jgi:ERCC4-type nuclease
MIYVDNRGKDEQTISEILMLMHYPVIVQHIDSGDYIIGDLAIERKTVSDLVSSVICREKGHNFWEQLKVMRDTYKKVLVIIEGFIDWKDRQLAGILYGIVDGWQIPYINTLSKADSAERIGQLHDRYGSSSTSKLPPAAVKKGYSTPHIKWMMLQCIPHIGPIVAKRILEKYPNIFTTNLRGPLNIEGLRRDSTEYLVKVLTE